ncbi:MAG: RNase A-like domain-containing protein [Dehalococcoidia bacterium]
MRRLRTWLPVVTVLAVVAGGYLLSSVVRDRGDGGGDAVAAAEKTALREEQAGQTPSPSAAGSRALTPRATAAVTPVPASALRDLGADEARGGHTLSRHTAKTDAELRDRLKREPDISAASSYTDQGAAERTVGAALKRDTKKVADWAKKSAPKQNLVLRTTMPSPVGRSVKQGSNAAVEARAAVVVLKADARGWFVLTSYPEAR